MKKPRVYVCCGGCCKKRKAKHEKLLASLAAVAEVKSIDCQDICEGPVAGLDVGGKRRWFRELDSGKAREALLRLITRGEMTGPLKERRVRRKG